MLKTVVKVEVAMSQREGGATAVEYGIMVAAIAAVIIAFVMILGGQVNAAFKKVSDLLPK